MTEREQERAAIVVAVRKQSEWNYKRCREEKILRGGGDPLSETYFACGSVLEAMANAIEGGDHLK